MNDAVALVDTAPALRMAILAAALSALPLVWTWWRQRRAGASRGAHAWLSALTLTTLFLTFDLVLFGAFTRLTDSGLGCPDWPGCYGSASPLGAQDAIDAAARAMPDGPVTQGKAWIEMIHRYFAATVGVLIVTMTIQAWRANRANRAESGASRVGPGFRASERSQRTHERLSTWWPALTLVWVIVQGAFGALTVTMKLFPAIVTVHLLLGMGLLALLAVQVARQRDLAPELLPATHALAWGVALMLVMQIALGGWVSTNYAVLACQDFPRCQGVWWPPMDFEQAFTLNRPLGRAADISRYLPFEALTAIHMAHRGFAVLLMLGVLLLAWRLRREGSALATRMAWALVGLALWQGVSGISNVVLGWPIVAALAHVAGASGFVIVMALLLARAGRVQGTQAS